MEYNRGIQNGRKTRDKSNIGFDYDLDLQTILKLKFIFNTQLFLIILIGNWGL